MWRPVEAERIFAACAGPAVRARQNAFHSCSCSSTDAWRMVEDVHQAVGIDQRPATGSLRHAAESVLFLSTCWRIGMCKASCLLWRELCMLVTGQNGAQVLDTVSADGSARPLTRLFLGLLSRHPLGRPVALSCKGRDVSRCHVSLDHVRPVQMSRTVFSFTP